MMKNGIDVSHWNGAPDWDKVKKTVDFAILKAGGSDSGVYTDSTFETNYKNAKSAGVPLGAYYYVGKNCISRNDGIADAKRFLEILKGKTFEYPVYMDFEDPTAATKEGNTEACIGFCETMEAAGYYCGIYASDVSGFGDRLDLKKLAKFDKWVARYGSKPTNTTEYGMWQHSSTGKVDGISGDVDLNECYKDYPTLIESKGLNGFVKTPDVVQPESTKPEEPDWKTLYEEAKAKLEAIKAIL